MPLSLYHLTVRRSASRRCWIASGGMSSGTSSAHTDTNAPRGSRYATRSAGVRSTTKYSITRTVGAPSGPSPIHVGASSPTPENVSFSWLASTLSGNSRLNRSPGMNPPMNAHSPSLQSGFWA